MPPSEAEVLNALSLYRKHIRDANHRAFSALIPMVEEATPDDPDWFESEEELEEARLAFIHDILGTHPQGVQPPITRPSDVLTHWDELVPQLSLDGTLVSRDASWREEMRGIYMRGVLKGLNEKCSGLATKWEFPPDFAVTLKHADSLEGPGWYRFREWTEAVVFFQFEGGSVTEDMVAEQVRAPDEITDQLGFLKEDYEIAGAWRCGDAGDEASSHIMYSRPRAAGEEGDWSWRYVACLGQYGINVYENVVELLEWYKSYREPRDESDWNITDQDVFGN
ncbi:hypothetical protein BJ166DRAFT_532439 [Pestalotiopsis sp. NC0098]|nr:hypothetical protein BJ166DRAFT_532439 [Pestalotiopsis sp. NC0098]